MKPELMHDFLKTQDGPCLSVYLPKLNETGSEANQRYLEQIKTEIHELMRWYHQRSMTDFFVETIDRIRYNPDLAFNSKNHVGIFINLNGTMEMSAIPLNIPRPEAISSPRVIMTFMLP